MKFLNKKQVKKFFASIPHTLDLNILTLFQKEKKLFLVTKTAANLGITSLQVHSMGLFLGTLDNKQLIVSPFARFLLK